MPYIEKEARVRLDPAIQLLLDELQSLEVGPINKGDLNYAITNLVLGYVKSAGKSYSTLSDVTGVLNDVKTEFERRVVAKYEDEKCKLNGDVYDES